MTLSDCFYHSCSDREIQEGTSDVLATNYGVPQGSILGPLLFILYLNDLEKYLKYCNPATYADDAALFKSAGVSR